MPHAELLADLAHGELRALERERGGVRRDAEAGNAGDGAEDLLGEAVAEVVLSAVGAQVGEREDGERAAVVGGGGGLRGARAEREARDRGGDGDAGDHADEPPALAGAVAAGSGDRRDGDRCVPVPSDSSWATSASASG